MPESRTRPIDHRMAPVLLALVLAASAISSATADEPAAATVDSSTSAASIDPVFDCYRANSAWGLTYAGNVIDRNGQVWTYSRRGKTLPVPIREGENSWFSAADFVAKYEGGTAKQKIDAAALGEHVALIGKAAGGTITSTDTGVRDAGGSTCHAYEFDAAHGRYHDVELGSDGGVSDLRIINSAPEAKALLDWLRDVGVAR